MEAGEAVITVSDGSNRILLFAQPFTGKVGDTIRGRVGALGSRGIQRVECMTAVRQSASNLSCEFVGTVECDGGRIVGLGDFKIEIDDEMPGDLRAGDLVSVVADRLDFIE